MNNLILIRKFIDLEFDYLFYSIFKNTNIFNINNCLISNYILRITKSISDKGLIKLELEQVFSHEIVRHEMHLL